MLDSASLKRAFNLRRLGYCLLPLVLGMGAALVLLLAAGGRAYASTLTYPGCGASIQACINSASAGDTILISAGDYTESLTLSKSVSLTGALSSTTILHAMPNSRVLTVTGAAVNSSVVISGLTFTGGNVTGTQTCPQSCGGGILITATAQPQLENIILTNNSAFEGGGLFNSADATLTSSIVTSNTATSDTANGFGGGVYNDGTLTITSSTVSNDLAASSYNSAAGGGGLYGAAGGNVTLTSSTISNNTAGYGGGIFNGGTLTITSSTISNNTASFGGGVKNAGTLTITSSTITSNTGFVGGGIESYDTLTITSSTVSNNTASSGGGLTNDDGGNATVDSSSITSNTASFSGGGIQNYGTLTITSSTITSNAAPTYAGFGGGGIANGGTLTFAGGTISNNTAIFGKGGGIYSTGTLTLTGSGLSDNSAPRGFGGALYTSGNAALTSSTLMSNTATYGGGGVQNDGALTLSGGTLSNNTAIEGGGLYNNGNASLTSDTITFNTATSGTGFDGGGGISNGGILTITSGTISNNATPAWGGGVKNIGSLAMTSSAITSNTSTSYGGGGLFNSGTLLITSSTISGNTGPYGGGVYMENTGFVGNARIVNALFAGNGASQEGAALYLATAGSVAILHSTIASPTLGSGAAIVTVNGTIGITDTIITSYTTGISLTAGSVFEDYNLFFDVPVTVTGGVNSGGHSFVSDPGFLDPASDDYHITAASAARDAGVNTGVSLDFDGDPRPMGGDFDIGYDEFRTPVAVADKYVIAQDTTLLVAAPGALANDTDFNLGPMTATLASGPAVGTLNLQPDGSFTYTPPLGFSGLVTFTYQSGAAGLLSAPAAATVIVNAPPLAVPGEPQTVTVGQPVTLDGSASSDLDNNLPLTFGWHQAGGPAVVLSSLTISRPTVTAPAAPALLTFTLTVSDAYGLASLPATATVTVTDQSIAGLSAASSSPTVLGQATTLAASLTAGTNVTFTWGLGDGATGAGVTTTHTYPALGFYPAVVTATNSLGSLTATTTVAVDDVPLAASDAYTTTENVALHVAAPGVLANDSDAFPGGLSAHLLSGPATGTLVLAATGAFTYTPPLGFSGLVTFLYRAGDGLLFSPPTLVHIIVNAFKLYLPLVRR